VHCANVSSPTESVSGAELVRLYVQPRSQHGGIGRLLISEGEKLAFDHSLSCLWLTAWEGNVGALAFYRRMGYAEIGMTTYSFEGNTYGNRLFAKKLDTA
jgi:ribosomal protein S18 acetylase RimI-like enzyme